VVTGAGTVAAADPSAGQRRVDRMRDGEFEAAVAEPADMVSHLPGPFGQSTRAAFVSMAHDLGWQRMSNQVEAMAYRVDVSARLGGITCPALMLWGSEDRFPLPNEKAWRWQRPCLMRAMPTSRVRAFPEFGSAGGDGFAPSALA
jgi:pimeloyl-ACP methyl ester carboxylesterase